jgi:hypothetical protein
MLYERKINEKEWHQATKPLTFLTLLPAVLINYSSAHPVQANLIKNSFVLMAIIQKLVCIPTQKYTVFQFV